MFGINLNRFKEKYVTVEVWYDYKYNYLWLRRVYATDKRGNPIDVGTTSPPKARMFKRKMMNPQNFSSIKVYSYIDKSEKLNYKNL